MLIARESSLLVMVISWIPVDSECIAHIPYCQLNTRWQLSFSSPHLPSSGFNLVIYLWWVCKVLFCYCSSSNSQSKALWGTKGIHLESSITDQSLHDGDIIPCGVPFPIRWLVGTKNQKGLPMTVSVHALKRKTRMCIPGYGLNKLFVRY